MVRAGVVSHPQQWPCNGYNEIISPPERYTLININTLIKLCGINDLTLFKELYKQWVETELKLNILKRQDKWTESLAVGSKQFIENYIQHFEASNKKICQTDDEYQIREGNAAYSGLFAPKMEALRANNSHSWNESA